MSKVVDLFGVDVAANPDADWRRIVGDQNCPFAGKRCFKVRKSQPGISIGTCTIHHGREPAPVMIRPNRLTERGQVFVDCLHLLQIHHKISTFEHMNKNLVLIIQDCLLNYMKRTFSFGRLSAPRDADPMHFHSYKLVHDDAGHRLKLDERFSTNTEGVTVCLGSQAEANVDMDQVVTAIEAKISPATLFKLN